MANRASFKRAELHQLSNLLTGALEGSGPTLNYRQGHDDTSVAQNASTLLKREITAQDLRRVRHQMIGKLATEGRPSSELLADLLRITTNQNKTISDLMARVRALEDQYTAPQDEPDVPEINTATVERKDQRNGRYYHAR